MNTSPELQEEILKYQKGNAQSFNQIYELSYKYLHTCVIHVVKDEDIAMDMLQETYLEISKSISQLKNEEGFLNWAATIANRKCYAYLKKQKDIVLYANNGEDESDDFFENIADNEEFIPEAVLQDKEKQRLIKEIIDGLTDIQRLCVIGFYYNEQKQDEIAEELGIPVNTVKSHLNRAKAKIKEAVVELDEKKGTRLYSFAPFMLLLFKEEVQACVLKPMTKALASAVGASATAGTASGIVTEFIAKVKAFWTSATTATKVTIGVTATALTIGGTAAVFMEDTEPESVSEIESTDENYVYEEAIEEIWLPDESVEVDPQLIEKMYELGDYLWAGDMDNALKLFGAYYETSDGIIQDFLNYYDPRTTRAAGSNIIEDTGREYCIGFHPKGDESMGVTYAYIGGYENGMRSGKGFVLERNVLVEANWVDGVPQGDVKYYKYIIDSEGKAYSEYMEIAVVDGIYHGEGIFITDDERTDAYGVRNLTATYDNGVLLHMLTETGGLALTESNPNFKYGVPGFGDIIDVYPGM